MFSIVHSFYSIGKVLEHVMLYIVYTMWNTSEYEHIVLSYT